MMTDSSAKLTGRGSGGKTTVRHTVQWQWLKRSALTHLDSGQSDGRTPIAGPWRGGVFFRICCRACMTPIQTRGEFIQSKCQKKGGRRLFIVGQSEEGMQRQMNTMPASSLLSPSHTTLGM